MRRDADHRVLAGYPYAADVAEIIGIDRLYGDDWNRDHIAKHQVVPEEVEQAVITSLVTNETYKSRYQLIGSTLSGRVLSVIFGAVPDQENVWYVFSARPASRKERRVHESMRRGPSDKET